MLIALALLPLYIGLYQTQLLIYGLIAAIAALGFNLLLGYTGLLSFGHSAFFGIGAYSVAFLLRDAGIHSMELYILLGVPIVAIASALFGYICVRHTRIFFGILTLALSQVLYSLALKFFWVTGGTDGLRVAATHAARRDDDASRGAGSFQRFIDAYYYYVLAVFAVSRRDHVDDRAFAVRQGPAGHPRQRDTRALPRLAHPPLPLARPS